MDASRPQPSPTPALPAVTNPRTPIRVPEHQNTRPVKVLRITAVQPDHGPTAGRVTVSILGTNFTPDARFFFGDNECTYPFFISSGVFNCTIPPHPPGPVDVSVQVPGQGRAVLHNAFRYESPVTLSACSPSQGRTQGGEPITLTGSGFKDSCLFMLGHRIIADVRVLDDAHAYGLTPPGLPGVADLHVICDRGSADLSDAFTYYDPGTLPASRTFRILGVDPANGPAQGGTRVTIFGRNLVPGMHIDFGGIPAPSARVMSPTVIEAVTPPGSPGPVDVTATWDKRESRLRGAFTYLYGRMRILSVTPDSASIAGNGLIHITGTDFTPDLRVFFGSHEAMETQFLDANRIIARAPAVDNPESVVLSLIGPDKIVMYGRPIRLFNPMRIPGGAYGPPIRETINLAVVSQGRIPASNAVVIVNNMVMHTNKQGLVTLSQPGVKGPVTVTATKDGYSAATYVGIDATNITLAISKKPDPNGTPPQPGKPVYCTFKGRIRDFNKYGLNQPGDTTHRLVVCSTSYTGLYGVNPDPGKGAIPDDQGNFQVTTRMGRLALVCTLSVNRGAGFVAERMGMVRDLVCSKNKPEQDGIVVSLDIPLHRSVFLRFPEPPEHPMGTKGPITRFSFHLGDDGYVDFNSNTKPLFANILEMPGQPDCMQCLEGQGYAFDLYVHAATPNGMPYSRIMLKDLVPTDTTQALVVGPGGAKVVDLNLPWRVTAAAGHGDFMVAAGSAGMVAMGTPDALDLGPARVDDLITALFVAGKCDFFMGLKNGRVLHCDCSACQDMARLPRGSVDGMAVADGQFYVLSMGRLMTLVNGVYQQVGQGADFTCLAACNGRLAAGDMQGRVMQDKGGGLEEVAGLDGPVLGLCSQGDGGLVAVTKSQLWTSDVGRALKIPGTKHALGVVCPDGGPVVFGGQGLAMRFNGARFNDLSVQGLHTTFTTGCVAGDKVFLSGVTYMQTQDFLDFPQIQAPKEGSTGWDGQTIAWMPMHDPRPSFCQVLLSQPGVWSFWVILGPGNVSVIHLPDLRNMAGYDLVPGGAKVLNVTCGRKPGFDFHNFSRYDTGLYNLPAYSANMAHFQ